MPRSANEKIVPYVRQPEGVTAGRGPYFATAALMGGYALGVLAESHEGRPKLEGNPAHRPASATNAFAQALILQMYDPDRSQAVLNAGRSPRGSSSRRHQRHAGQPGPGRAAHPDGR